MPLPSEAQQRARVIPSVGVLWHAGSAEEERVPLGALVDAFRKLGYIGERTVVFEHRFPNEQPERFGTFAYDLVRIKSRCTDRRDTTSSVGCAERYAPCLWTQ